MTTPLLLLATWTALLGRGEASPLKLAAAQVLTNDGDFPGNLHRVSVAVKNAKAGGADLVAFPETSLDGWMYNRAIKAAPPVPGNWSDTIGQLAAAHSIWVLIGIVETDGDLLYDVAILVDASGRLVMKHRKNNIVCGNAGCNYSPGRNVSVAETPWGKVGVLICADTFKPDVVARMAALRPDVLLVPYGFQAPPEQNVGNGNTLVQRVAMTAKAVGAPTAGINNVGAVGGNTGTPGHASMGVANTYCGWSNWADRSGKTMAVAADRDTDLAFWTIETNKAQPLLSGAKTDDPDAAAAVAPPEFPGLGVSIAGRAEGWKPSTPYVCPYCMSCNQTDSHGECWPNGPDRSSGIPRAWTSAQAPEPASFLNLSFELSDFTNESSAGPWTIDTADFSRGRDCH
jgi:predicted amidohydrolase